MISFRFHLVSIAAVFLALAVGIVIGAGVVDRATVSFLEQRVAEVEERRLATNRKNDELRSDVGRWEAFSDSVTTRLIANRLQGVRVIGLAPTGVDRASVDTLVSSVGSAGGTYDGTVWFTSKWKLDSKSAGELSRLLKIEDGSKPDDLGATALRRISDSWKPEPPDSLSGPLQDSGFLTLDHPENSAPLTQAPVPGTLFVVVGGAKPDVSNEQLTTPLVESLIAGGFPLLVAEPHVDGAASKSMVASIRDDPDLSPRVSTVDDLGDNRGVVATVLALDHLRKGRRGHYGIGPGAQAVVPSQ